MLAGPLLLPHAPTATARVRSAAPAPTLAFERAGFRAPLSGSSAQASSPATQPTPTTTAPPPVGSATATSPTAAPLAGTSAATSSAGTSSAATSDAGAAPAPATTAQPAVTTSNSTTGVATWYAEAPPDGCASPFLPFGTEVEVADDATGATTSCVVDDREQTNGDRVLDMSTTGFAQLASVTQGVITVTISW